MACARLSARPIASCSAEPADGATAVTLARSSCERSCNRMYARAATACARKLQPPVRGLQPYVRELEPYACADCNRLYVGCSRRCVGCDRTLGAWAAAACSVIFDVNPHWWRDARVAPSALSVSGSPTCACEGGTLVAKVARWQGGKAGTGVGMGFSKAGAASEVSRSLIGGGAPTFLRSGSVPEAPTSLAARLAIGRRWQAVAVAGGAHTPRQDGAFGLLPRVVLWRQLLCIPSA